jgi:hypothetical protein
LLFLVNDQQKQSQHCFYWIILLSFCLPPYAAVASHRDYGRGWGEVSLLFSIHVSRYELYKITFNEGFFSILFSLKSVTII